MGPMEIPVLCTPLRHRRNLDFCCGGGGALIGLLSFLGWQTGSSMGRGLIHDACNCRILTEKIAPYPSPGGCAKALPPSLLCHMYTVCSVYIHVASCI